MFNCHRKTLQAIAFFLLLSAPAIGGTAVLPLQDLLGTYAYDTLGTVPPPYYKSATIQTGYGLADVTKARLVLEGTSSPAIVRGDGVLRESQEVVTDTGLSIVSQIGYDIYLDFPDLSPGGFAYVSYDFNAPYDTHRPIPGPPGPDYFSATIEMSLCPTTSPWGPPAFFVPPAEGTVWPWYYGLVLVEPATATVTNAYLVLEGPTLPEPATLSLLALGGLLALRRRARR